MRRLVFFALAAAFLVFGCGHTPQQKAIIDVYQSSINGEEGEQLFHDFMNGHEASMYFVSTKTNKPIMFFADPKRKEVSIVFNDSNGVFRIVDTYAFFDSTEKRWKMTLPSYAKLPPSELAAMKAEYTKLVDNLEAIAQAKKENEEAQAKNAELAAEIEKAKKAKARAKKAKAAEKAQAAQTPAPAPQDQASAAPAAKTEAKTETANAPAASGQESAPKPAPKPEDTKWNF